MHENTYLLTRSTQAESIPIWIRRIKEASFHDAKNYEKSIQY